ncbi:MAG: hypothetical protein Q7R41_17955, partial [Phycisphaerales bacterium]|nr:hypothetical protein [Phycisphaerales bacterium]
FSPRDPSSHPRAAGFRPPDPSGVDPAAWEERLSLAAREFADCWRARNKPSGLRDILDALDPRAPGRSDIASFHAES